MGHQFLSDSWFDEVKKLGTKPEDAVVQDIVRDVMHPESKRSHASDMPSDASTESVDEESENEGDEEPASEVVEMLPTGEPPGAFEPVKPPIIEGEFEVIELPTTDAAGITIPEDLRPLFQAGKVCKDLARELSGMKSRAEKEASGNETAFATFSLNGFVEAIGNARRALLMGFPYVICPYCGPKATAATRKKCRSCKGLGYLNKAQYRCVSEDIKKGILKRKKGR